MARLARGLRKYRLERQLRPLVLVFATAVLSFGASTGYSQHRLAAIDAAAVDIAEDAAPSIQSLADARAELQRLRALLTDQVAGAEVSGIAPVTGGDVDRQLSAFEQAIDRYLAIPVSPVEEELWGDATRELADVSAAVGRVEAAVAAHDSGASASSLAAASTAIDEAASTIQRSTEYHARRAHALAWTIEDTRASTARITFALDVVSAALTFAAVILAIAVAHRHAALADAHARLLAERAKDLEEFAGRVAHDIMSPLSTVALSFHLVERAGDESKRRDVLARARRSLKVVEDTVSGLLTFARAGAPPLAGERTDVRGVVENLMAELRPAAEAAAIDLVVEPVAPFEVACSSGVLTSLLGNLARNALKYMGDGPERRVTARVLEAGSRVRFEVEDTGPGVDPKLGDSVFQPYVRGRGHGQPGIGIGLATVRRMAEAHGGSVGVVSEPGHGALFWFELPKAGPAGAAQAA